MLNKDKMVIFGMSLGLFAVVLLAFPNVSQAFCGFYVAKADTKLFNKASKVVIARKDDRTVVTMANDYQGELKEFAIVVPVPTVLEKGQIHVTENKIIDHLDAYTAPRLVEYFDGNPCERLMIKSAGMFESATRGLAQKAARMDAKKLGVTIEAQYTVGEYDIMILSAKESSGLQTWLVQNGYKIPAGADRVLESYIKQGIKFFVAKVNLEEQLKTGAKYLRPISIAYESERFMLPVRLGTVNSTGTQELFIFTLTSKGRVEPTNYRTVKIASDKEVPLYVKDEFAKFYVSMFDNAVKREGLGTIFLEYAWDMSWCDPCAADPLSREELRELGVHWLNGDKEEDIIIQGQRRIGIVPGPPSIAGGAVNVFVTRMHVRYDAESLPEDIKFQETADRTNFQGRYILRHPFKGKAKCKEAQRYYGELEKRFEREAQNLANITGWDISDIRRKMKDSGQDIEEITGREDDDSSDSDGSSGNRWWKRIWE